MNNIFAIDERQNVPPIECNVEICLFSFGLPISVAQRLQVRLPATCIHRGRAKERTRRGQHGRMRTMIIKQPPADQTLGWPIIRLPLAPAPRMPSQMPGCPHQCSTTGRDDANDQSVINHKTPLNSSVQQVGMASELLCIRQTRLTGLRLELNLEPTAHCARHTLLHMAPKWSSYWTTRAGLSC